ncbi:MAG: hypothetical protein HY658_01345 [Actinobacteria bacterium]|nr:hypothetical protein [Actinomycetota bacterium]
MRSIFASVAVVLVLAGCRTPASGESSLAEPAAPAIPPEPSPYTQVTAGPVQALVPNRWDAAVVTGQDTLQEGLMASPRLEDWRRMDGSVQGISAMWLDVARVGIPTDYYYLAASAPLLGALTGGEDCRRRFHRVIVDHRPSFAADDPSAGDFVARAAGTCTTASGRSTRWAYFVAAPGFGPVREVGIPNSGLYVVVAVVRDSPEAARELRQLLQGARFGGTTVLELLQAARTSAGQL